MKPEVVEVFGKACYLYLCSEAEYLLIQPVDEHDLELLDKEVEIIQSLSDKPFSLVAWMFWKVMRLTAPERPWVSPLGKRQLASLWLPSARG